MHSLLTYHVNQKKHPSKQAQVTPGKIHIEPENGPLEDYPPLQTSRFQVPC